MPRNSLFPQGSYSEQNLTESLIIESIRQYGREFYYIPRTLVAEDKILGEDPLSTFENAYMIECYIDNVENFGGNGAFMSKFGLMIEEQAQLTVARKRWEELVASAGTTILPNRPVEGDLMYFPLTKGLFEIKFVEHQNPFYQLGQLYTYKLTVELFRYASETMETGIEKVDAFNDLTLAKPAANLNTVNTDVPKSYGDNEKLKDKKDEYFFNENNPFGNL